MTWLINRNVVYRTQSLLSLQWNSCSLKLHPGTVGHVMTAVILTYLVLSIEPMVRCMLRRISDAGIFYCSENSLQCYNESAEPMAERIVRIRSMQPGAREWLTRATHRAQHPVLRAGAGVSSPSTLFYPPTIPLQQYLLKATINRGHGTRFVFVCVLSLRRNTRWWVYRYVGVVHDTLTGTLDYQRV